MAAAAATYTEVVYHRSQCSRFSAGVSIPLPAQHAAANYVINNRQCLQTQDCVTTPRLSRVVQGPVATSQKLGVSIVPPFFPLSFPPSLSLSVLPPPPFPFSLPSLPLFFSSLPPFLFPSFFPSLPSFLSLPYLPGGPPTEASYRFWGSSVSSLSRSG